MKLFDMTVAATGLNEAAARAAGIAFDKTVTFSASHATYYPGATNMTVKTLFSPETGRLFGAQIVGCLLYTSQLFLSNHMGGNLTHAGCFSGII